MNTSRKHKIGRIKCFYEKWLPCECNKLSLGALRMQDLKTMDKKTERLKFDGLENFVKNLSVVFHFVIFQPPFYSISILFILSDYSVIFRSCIIRSCI